jgi:hypothetical protein
LLWCVPCFEDINNFEISAHIYDSGQEGNSAKMKY